MADKVMEKTIADKNIMNDDINSDSAVKTKSKPAKKAKKKKKGILSRIIPIIILLAVIAFLVGVLGFNFLNIRNAYLYPVLRDVPIIGGLLPPEESATPGEYDGLTRDELIAQITSLNERLKRNQEQINEINSESTKNDTELARLRELEDQHLQFKAEKAEFDRLIAENDPRAYAEFYESINPDNAAELYKEAVVINQLADEVRRYVRTFSDMDESSAAKIMEQWITTDMSLIVSVLQNLSSDKRAAILSSMDAKNAAAVSKMLSPF